MTSIKALLLAGGVGLMAATSVAAESYRMAHFQPEGETTVRTAKWFAEALNEPFTGVHAQASASDKVKLPTGHRKWCSGHSVSASTAPTQSSSTMNALTVMGVVENTGTTKSPIWKLTDTPQTAAFRNMYQPQAAAKAA